MTFVELPPVNDDNTCSGCGARVDFPTGACRCGAAAPADSAAPHTDACNRSDATYCVCADADRDEFGHPPSAAPEVPPGHHLNGPPCDCPRIGAAALSEAAVRMRLYQCPGCWSVMRFPATGDYECDCGERMTCIDLRLRPDTDARVLRRSWDDQGRWLGCTAVKDCPEKREHRHEAVESPFGGYAAGPVVLAAPPEERADREGTE